MPKPTKMLVEAFNLNYSNILNHPRLLEMHHSILRTFICIKRYDLECKKKRIRKVKTIS